ncbi:hypothetical protein EMIT0P74_90188 [Pseudomonas sp. IT-P74]
MRGFFTVQMTHFCSALAVLVAPEWGEGVTYSYPELWGGYGVNKSGYCCTNSGQSNSVAPGTTASFSRWSLQL